MNAAYRKLLEKQGYRFVGEHSAIKVCEWTRKSLVDKGVCYKQRFYGINCHRCVQMTVAVNFCNMDCLFCWRERNNSPFVAVDDPQDILMKIRLEQKKLLNGFGGYQKANRSKLKESEQPMHYAISLNGENLAYPRLNELLREIKKSGGTSFVVTNGQFPEVLAKMEMPTQLYISLSAPNEELFKKIDRPMLKDGWQRLMESFDIMRALKTRRTIRMTLINKLNTVEPEGWAAIASRAEPDFIEVKSYMRLGASKARLPAGSMLTHMEVRDFAEEIGKLCGYKIIDEQPESRVVLMMKKDTPKRIMKFS